LYHKTVQMQIIALEPPGNVARDLALFRRALFAALGEGSALAFPEIVPLAFASRPPRQRRGSLAACWDGVEGRFSSSGLFLARGGLYLGMSGPLPLLSSRASGCLGEAQGELGSSWPLEAGVGFFLCRPSEPELALAAAARIGAPRADFLDCSLSRSCLRFGTDPFSAMTWRELGRAKRRTGRKGSSDSMTSLAQGRVGRKD
jgi:hypothetical protein